MQEKRETGIMQHPTIGEASLRVSDIQIQMRFTSVAERLQTMICATLVLTSPRLI